MTDQSAVCLFPEQAHTVWYWDERGADSLPVPCTANLDNHADAMTFIDDQLGTPEWLGWVKAFRQNNSAYTCYYWQAPAKSPGPPPEPYRPLAPGSDPAGLGANALGWGCIMSVTFVGFFLAGVLVGLLIA